MINDLLGIKYPIFMGAMANITDGKFAAAVSNAGGLGIIGAGAHDAKWMREQIKICRENTDKPFGVGILLISPFCDDIAKVIIEENVPIVTTGAGMANKYIKLFNEHNIKTIPVVGTVSGAIRSERAGAFAVIAEGMESGGHVGEETTMALVPQVAKAVKIPVIAAGGIADGKTFLSALALGAQGIQAGTIFIATKEAPVSDVYKNIIVEARDIDTIVDENKFGLRIRIFKNNLARNIKTVFGKAESMLEYELLTSKYHEKAMNGDYNDGLFMMGQNAGLVTEIRTVEELLKYLMDDLNKELNNMKNAL